MLPQVRARSGVIALLAAALTFGATLGAIGRPAGAQSQDLIDSDPAVVAARAALVQAQSDAHEAVAKVEELSEQQADVNNAIAADQQHIDELGQQIQSLAAQHAALKVKASDRAVALYIAHGDGTAIIDMLSDNALDALRRKQLGEAAARSDQQTLQKLVDTSNALDAARTSYATDQKNLQQRQTALDALAVQLAQEQAIMNQRVADANAALERAREIGALHAANNPVMGPNILTAAQMTAWWRSKGYDARLNGISVQDLAQIFLDEGADEHVRGDFAFAQAIVETGGFASAPANNYSGMGWCDSCTRGTTFPTPRDGVRAQIQLLEDYADPTATAARLAHPPSPYWWSLDPVVAAHQFDTFYAKGWAPTWSDMGHGNWATDPNYASKVIGVYNQMYAYSLSHNA
jgi:peptidoglycan hydrolase CwlO-like protein